MLSRFFIDRPVFAWVIAIVIMLGGAIAAFSLPVEQYPVIAPPAVVINAFYPGADAESLQNSVTQVIEQQLTGVDHLLYFSSSSASSGQVTITATFEAGTNPDIAQVQVQNKVQQAVPILPTEVQQQGITVAKAQSNFILIVARVRPERALRQCRYRRFHRQPAAGPASAASAASAMSRCSARNMPCASGSIPTSCKNYGLEPSDVRNAILAQNTQVSAGQIGGQPAAPEHRS